MSIILHHYRGQSTGHIAWTINGRYFSFQPEHSGRSIDLERGPVPLPGGERVFMMTARPSMNATAARDVAKYAAFEPELITIEGCDAARAEQFLDDLLAVRLPYILWDQTYIGSINCVTSAIMIFTVMLPDRLPSLWEAKWGAIFRKIRAVGRQPGGDWPGHVIKNAEPTLMYVEQVAQMAREWAENDFQPFGVEQDALPKARPPIGDPISAPPEPEGLWSRPPDAAG